VASSTPESTPSGSPASTAALSGEDLGITALSLDEAGNGFSDADFRSECTQSLDRAFEEGHAVENAAIELKTLRMASNVSLTAVKEVITAFLASKIPLKDGDATAQKKVVNVMISRWGALLSAIGSESPVENILQLQVSAAVALTALRKRNIPERCAVVILHQHSGKAQALWPCPRRVL